MGEVSIWISCACCASKQHLIGDCPKNRTKLNSTSWTLKGFDTSQVVNLSLQMGSKKSDKPLGRAIRGRGNADQYPSRRGNGRESPLGQNSFDDDDDDSANFYRPRINEPPPRHIRFDGRNVGRDAEFGRSVDEPGPYSGRYDDDDYGYRPSYRDRDERGYDRYGDRRRSRSPMPRGGDRWLPPLPTEPPPSLPHRPPPRQSQHNNQQGTGGRNPGGGGRGNRQQRRGGGNANSNKQSGGGRKGNGKKGEAFQPMPSAGKKAWQKLKT